MHSCAVVASSVGGLQELINESGGGTLVNASDIPGMASTILGLIANVELCREMGQSGTAWVRSCLRPELIAEQYKSYYNDIQCRQISRGFF